MNPFLTFLNASISSWNEFIKSASNYDEDEREESESDLPVLPSLPFNTQFSLESWRFLQDYFAGSYLQSLSPNFPLYNLNVQECDFDDEIEKEIDLAFEGRTRIFLGEEICKSHSNAFYLICDDDSHYRSFLHVNYVLGSTQTLNGFELYTQDKKLYDQLGSIVKKDQQKRSHYQGVVQVMTQVHGNMEPQKLGKFDHQFIEENYDTLLVKQFHNIIASLSSSTPRGRITILEGKPGTGKSWFVRGIISEYPANYIYIPPSLNAHIGEPSFMSAFLQEKLKNLPIVLIMEEADTCLTRREMDNMSQVADLLNITDGLFGELLNIHVIATTNAKKLDIDPAIIRPGRLLEHVHFECLPVSHAQKIFQRLTDNNGDISCISEGMTLADIYHMSECVKT